MLLAEREKTMNEYGSIVSEALLTHFPNPMGKTLLNNAQNTCNIEAILPLQPSSGHALSKTRDISSSLIFTHRQGCHQGWKN
jgi:hypothetical protein